ncbi:hypothetical protein J6590_060304 [Homalodisca vitripennis]|nr:hypothetical protein J6590_060304 [Homalodisca vitripennis]
MKKKLLCERHFRQGDILPSGRLVHNAVPIQYSSEEKEPTPGPSHQTSPSPRVKRTAESPRRYLGRSLTEHPSPTVSTSSASFSVETVSPSVHGWIESASPARQCLSKIKRALFQSPTKNKLLSKINSQTKNLASKRAKISRLKCQLLKFSRLGGLKFKSKEAEILFRMQIHKKNMHWSSDEKNLLPLCS